MTRSEAIQCYCQQVEHWIDLPKKRRRELLDGLRERGVLARWWSTPEIADWLRISIGTDGDMAALMAALDGILLYSESS